MKIKPVEKTKSTDWGQVSEKFDEIQIQVGQKDLASTSEAQTRFHIIDRLIKEVLLWEHGQIEVEEPTEGVRKGYIDYILRAQDSVILIEAKKIGATFPSPTKQRKLKLTGSVLGSGDIGEAIKQAEEYAKTKEAELVVVTNGLCWCCFPFEKEKDRNDIYATLFFPFSNPGDEEKLFTILGSVNVGNGSLSLINSEKPALIEKKLLSQVLDSDARVDRNNIADYIMPALGKALYSESLISNKDQLERCFVTTLGRTKHDKMLGIYFADSKPPTVAPAKRLSAEKPSGTLHRLIKLSEPSFAPPVTLIIGQVGAGKSTYLKHFEMVSGENVLEENKAHWIYIDFEAMGRTGEPREFIYKKLREYILAEHPSNPTDFRNAIQPAYQNEIAGLARGPLAPIFSSDKKEFDKLISEHINKEYESIEPFVDKILGYLSKKFLCIVILDNIDLYEDEELEKTVFSEGIALSKRIHCHIIVCIRDRTFVHHRNDSSFDAYELRKFWLDPPPFKEVLSKRLTYSKKVLENRKAEIITDKGFKIKVNDLSIFFEVVQRSILSGTAGDCVDAIADNNIRKGLTLVTNFLTSGHIQADNAIKKYLDGERDYTFPFHEIFKGAVLGQWKYYKEERAECLNIFDSKLGARNLRLLRLFVLKHLWFAARSEESKEVRTRDLVGIFSRLGASEQRIIDCLNELYRAGLIKNITAEDITMESFIVITRRGGYYIKSLCCTLPYVEACLYDTAIDNETVWNELSAITSQIEPEASIPRKMELRKRRLLYFLDYYINLEKRHLELIGNYEHLRCLEEIKKGVSLGLEEAIRKSYRWYS